MLQKIVMPFNIYFYCQSISYRFLNKFSSTITSESSILKQWILKNVILDSSLNNRLSKSDQDFCILDRRNYCLQNLVGGNRNSYFKKMIGIKENKDNFTKAPLIELNNGKKMPILGLGTYKSLANEGEKAIKHAIDIGYRHIDTAYFYENEHEVGKAVKDKIEEGVIEREDMFIVTKLWSTFHDPEKVEIACKKSLENLDLDYIDLYLMHIPVGYVYVDDKTLLPKDDNGNLRLNDIDYIDTWKAMEELVRKGYCKSIGISNFNSEQIDRLLQHCEIKPVTNQVECHPALNQKKLIEFCKDRNIIITSYCPLARPEPEIKKPDFLYCEDTLRIAEKYNKTPSQIVLRYLVDIGTVPIPKSTNPGRIAQNLEIFDFKLDSDDISVIDQLNTGNRIVPFNLIKAQNHKYFPFNIEF